MSENISPHHKHKKIKFFSFLGLTNPVTPTIKVYDNALCMRKNKPVLNGRFFCV